MRPSGCCFFLPKRRRRRRFLCARTHTHTIFFVWRQEKKDGGDGKEETKKYLFQKKLNAYISQEKVIRGGFFWMKKTSNFLICVCVCTRCDTTDESFLEMNKWNELINNKKHMCLMLFWRRHDKTSLDCSP